jgi:hypothetical protein
MYNLLYEASDIVIGIINMTTRLAALFLPYLALANNGVGCVSRQRAPII